MNKWFMPIEQAAKQSVSATLLKKICRQNGIARHRKVSSHAMLLNLLVSDVTKRPTSAAVEQHDKAH